MGKRKKVLLAHLNSNGDCLYSTVVAKQIKKLNYRGSHLTWAVNSACKQSILLNPFVDEIWEVPTAKSVTTYDEWIAFVSEAERRKAAGEFDLIFYMQIIGESTLNFDGGIRSTTYSHYPHTIWVSQRPVLRLSEEEKEAVKTFAGESNLAGFERVLLIECGPDSFESALNPKSSLELAERLTSADPQLCVILSSNKKVERPSARIIDGSILSFRANAELSHYCTAFLGCGSGISQLMTTDMAKRLPMIMVVNEGQYYSSSLVHDHKFAGLSVKKILEVKENEHTIEKLEAALKLLFSSGIKAAKKKYHEPFVQNYKFYEDINELNMQNGDHERLFGVYLRVILRNGFSPITKAIYQQYKADKKMNLLKWPKRAERLVNK